MSGSITNTSAAPGYLQQIDTNVKGNVALTNLLQMAVIGITGLDPTLVRPRWQPQPPTQPPVTTDWCAIGIETFDLYDYPQIIHDGVNQVDNLYRLVRINLLTSFYGPNASALASALRDGFYISQNFGTLAQYGVRFRSAENIIYISELINSQYVPRVDLFLNFTHMIQRTYAIENLVGAEVDLSVDFPLPNGSTNVVLITEE